MTTALGRLEQVDLHKAWTTEAGHFTPWLAQAENLQLLGETIGVELELEAQEKDVGPFRADILCKDVNTDSWVLIENQLERTDHTHLGQLMTYAAGLKAVTIVWIARRFTDEHRAALDWLNEITDERFNFFGLEIELWRIGTSAVAPKFNVVCQPNDWSKEVRDGRKGVETGQLSEAKRAQLEFWTQFREYAQQKGTALRLNKAQPHCWMNVALGTSYSQLAAIASYWDSTNRSYETNELRAEVAVYGPYGRARFQALQAMKDEIEAEVGEPLTWYDYTSGQTCRIYLRRSASIADRTCWLEYHEWLLTKLEALHKAFAGRMRQVAEAVDGEATEAD